MSTTPQLLDFISSTGPATNQLSSVNINIDNIASLPKAFTDLFTPIALADGVAAYGAQKECVGFPLIGIQILATAKGAGFSSLAIQLQTSNIGGTSTAVWNDLGTPTTLSDVGSGVIAEPSYIFKMFRYYRLKLTSTGGTSTVYAVGLGNNT